MNEFHIVETQIRQLHARYTDAVWRKDLEAFGACFADDAEWRIAGHVLRGRASIVEFMRDAFEKYVRILMNFRTPILEVGDDWASGRTYVNEQSVVREGNRGYAPIGTYFERFVPIGGEWKFEWRLFQTNYIGPPDLSGDFFDAPDYGPPPAMPPLTEPTFDRSGLLSLLSK